MHGSPEVVDLSTVIEHVLEAIIGDASSTSHIKHL